MNKAHGITKENLLASLPAVLANDDNMAALASAVAEVLAARVGEIERVSIYSQIDRLPNELLDILANDFKVDWWDYSYSLQEKRNTLRQSWYVHKHMGTPAAVTAALSAIYPDSKVEEWWDYGGKPYHFRLLIPQDASTLDAVKYATVLSLVAYYKNLRSVLDSVTVLQRHEHHLYTGFAVRVGRIVSVGCEIPAALDVTYMTDEAGNLLSDETGNRIIDEEV